MYELGPFTRARRRDASCPVSWMWFRRPLAQEAAASRSLTSATSSQAGSARDTGLYSTVSPHSKGTPPHRWRLASAEEFMAASQDVSGRRAGGHSGWSFAAAIGLLAIAFAI